MKQKSIGAALNRILIAAGLCASVGFGYPAIVSAQSMGNYTNYPIFLSRNVPPNVLFLVDTGNYTLEAAYAGSNHWYPISWKPGTPTVDSSNNPYYAANVTLTNASSAGGNADNTNLRAIDLNNNLLTGADETAPADTFNSAYAYYGAFDPYRCYTYGSNSFNYGSVKVAVTDACASTMWDGNFLNWLSMRKQEVIYQVLVGGRPLPAQANSDGSANSLGGINVTGENGSSSTCSKSGSNWSPCWRYVKFVLNTALAGRAPTGLPSPTVNKIVGTTTTGITTGRFFGVGEGSIFVNDDGTLSPFDTASGNKYNIKVDLTTEPNSPSGIGVTGTCPDSTVSTFAGHLVCYQRDRSLGLFQTMRTDNMHVAVMFVNASTGNGGSLQFGFDQNFNSSSVTNIRNNQTQSFAPLAESLYEALCLYRKSQGPCYDNGNSATWGTGYNNATNTTGDPFFYATYNQEVPCCKNYVLMISPGIATNDGTNPTLQTPFPTASTMNPTWANNMGVKASTSAGDAASALAGDRLDDVAFYGRTHDLRSDLASPPSQYVTFYSVNAMGRKAGATLLASAAMYGGFKDNNGDSTSNFIPTSSNGGQPCTFPSNSNLNPGTAGQKYSYSEWDAVDANGNPNPDCVPDTFFDANDGYSLRDQILAAINDILKNSASGTSISVLASSSNGDGSIYQAYFYPETPKTPGSTDVVSWTGYFQGLFIDTYGNLREDHGGSAGAGDGKLVYSDDNIVATDLDADGNVMIRRYPDADGDGKADDPGYYATPRTGGTVATLREMQGMWEAGKKLALRNLTSKPRNIFTWVDKNNDGVVTSDEQMAFSSANAATLQKYLRAADTTAASNIISFLQGNPVSGMRDRDFSVDGTMVTWRLGDIVNSSPTIVGPPKERFDILYGDDGYRRFLQKWANRRQTAYVGANDGMLHAFNVGYYHRGSDASACPNCHGWYTTAPNDNNSGPELGEELWGFVPHYVLPQLVWYTQSNYTHISYVDLKPKVTDVKIFTAEAACNSGSPTPTPTAVGCIHPDGWGTILIMGMRFGGSCGSCAAVPGSGTGNGGPTLSVTADFGSGTQTRNFYSGYVVLDITDPTATPTVLMAFSNVDLGLTTSYPTVIRTNPSTNGSGTPVLKTDHTYARWMMLVGSGVHGYDGRAGGYASIFGVVLVTQGTLPAYAQFKMYDQTSSPLTQRDSYMSDLITFDRDLDFRSDAVYAGRTISGGASSGPAAGPLTGGTGLGYWTGKMYRFTMGTCTGSAVCPITTWGVLDGGFRLPTEMVTAVPISGTPVPLGPVTASSTVTLDNSGNTWVFFGTGRFMSAADKTDQHAQYLVGVKDSALNGCTQSVVSSCHNENLLDVTNATICVSCTSGAQVQNVGGVSTFSGLQDKIQGTTTTTAMDGWVIQLATNSGSTLLGAERNIVNPTLIGGAVFFPTFTPSNDVCVATGTSQIYGLYYLTGTGYTDPIFGVNASGQAVRAVNGGQGVASSVAMQIGSEPTGMAGYFQSSNSAINKISPKPPQLLWSQFMAWINQRV
jgi:type IV pilus assembly protein PilY1